MFESNGVSSLISSSARKYKTLHIANGAQVAQNMSESLDRQERWKERREEADRQRMGGAYIQGFMETAATLVVEEPLFNKGYWKCASGCKPFGQGLAMTPRACHSCHKQLIEWVPGP